MSKETVKVVEIDTNPAVKSLKDLRKELLGYKNEMANLEEGSDAFLEIANKAGELKHQIDEINESIKGASADFGDMLGNVSSVGAGLTGAFQAVAGGLQAIGVESEAVDKAILKMQGLMAVTQGLGAIDDGIKSWDKLSKAINVSNKSLGGFKKALIGTGLGALVVLLGSIIANWDEFSKSIGLSQEKLDKFGDAIKGAINVALSGIKGIGTAISRLIAGDFKGAQQAVKDGFAIQQNYIKGVEKAEEKRQETREKKAQKEHEEFIAKENEKLNIELERIKRKGLSEKATLEANLKVEQERLKLIKEETLEYEQQLSKLYDIQQSIIKLTNPDVLTELTAKSPEALTIPIKPNPNLSVDEMKKAVKNAIDKGLEELAEEDYNSTEERVRRLGNKMFESLSTTTQLLSESSLGISAGWIQSLMEFQEVFNMTMDVIKNDGKNTWSDYANIAVTALAGVGTMLNTLSNEQDASDKEGFERTKKLQIAATIMNMLSGIMAAWTSAMSPSNAWMTLPGQIAMGTATSAMIGTIGGLQIDKIKSQTMQSANPNTNINAKAVYGNLIAPVQYSSAVQGASTEGSIKNQKVVVLESDIVNTVNKVTVQEQENSY